MKCKSGCGGAIASYSHCQEYHFNKDLVEIHKSQNSRDQFKQHINKLDENKNELIERAFGFPFK